MLEAAARAAHEAVRAYMLALGDASSPPWNAVPDELREVVMRDVDAVFSGATPQVLHERWKRREEARGWRYGEKADKVKKTSPGLAAWDALSDEYKRRIGLMQSVALATGEALRTGKNLFGPQPPPREPQT